MVRTGFLLFVSAHISLLCALGILLVAAAGNDGTNDFTYPASYSSVISVGSSRRERHQIRIFSHSSSLFINVAAVDDEEVKASFSNFNSQVEVSAAGVSVLSTYADYPYSTVVVDSVEYPSYMMEGDQVCSCEKASKIALSFPLFTSRRRFLSLHL